MRIFRSVLQNEALRKVVAELAEHPAVHGIVLDLDPWWDWARRVRWVLLSRGHSEASVFDVLEARTTRPWPGSYYGFPLLPDLEVDELDFAPPAQESDLAWVPPPRLFSSPFPHKESIAFVLRVALLPPAQRRSREETRPQHSPSPVRVAFEVRPPAELYASPLAPHRPLVGGISVGTTDMAGTLGGILEDAGGRRYGLTCAHVCAAGERAFQPAQGDSPGGGAVGIVTRASTLRTSVSPGPCNPYAGGAGALNAVDAALIEVDSSTTSQLSVLGLGPVTGVAPRDSLDPGEVVAVAGKQSGLHSLYVGGLALAYRLRVLTAREGKPVVEYASFRDLVVLEWASKLRTVLGWPIRKGDSGAWVLRPSAAGHEWCAVVVGGDWARGYAILSENVSEWWKSLGLDLSVR